MALLTESLSVRALFEFRENLELGDGMFKEITGVEAKDLMAFRRGRLKGKPVITPPAAERIEQCKKAFDLALEFCGDQDRALDWFYADAPSFGGKSPIDLTLTLGGLEKIQAFIDSLRQTIAAANLNNAPEISKPATSANTVDASAATQPAKPAPVVISPPVGAKPTDNQTTPKAIPAIAVKPASPASGVAAAAPRATSYVPGGMARTRAQALVLAQLPKGDAATETHSATLNKPVSVETRPSAAPTTKSDSAQKSEANTTTTPEPSIAGASETGVPVQTPNTSRALASPPLGVNPEKRIFLLKEPFTRLREKKTDLTLKEISAAMLKRGCSRFAVQTHASRLVKSYTWATWTEVANLAEILEADPYDLGSVQSE